MQIFLFKIWLERKTKNHFVETLCTFLEKIDREFQWSKAYNWYSDLPTEDALKKHLRVSRLTKAGFLPKVFNVLEFMLWCEKCFDTTRRVIHVSDTSTQPISLNPIIFQRMLRLLEPNKEFKIAEADDFITNHGAPKRLLPHFIDSLFGIKINSFQFDVSILKEPFMDFSWLFT